jgi:putative oxidoreductase
MADRDGQSFVGRVAPYALSIMRIIVAFLYMQHGAQKLFGFHAMPQMPTPPLLSFMGFAGFLEFVGGLLILLGLFTRPVAFVLSGQMAVAYFMVHGPKGFWPMANGGDLAVLLCFVFFYLAFAGGGPVSLDRSIRKEA